jgi:peptidoglycan hydrolase-like protein with peptidoglycan-binding domain
MKFKSESNIILRLLIVSIVLLFFQTFLVEAKYTLAAQKQKKYVSRYIPKLVKRAQKTLIKKGYDPGEVDGIWGIKTSNSLKKFQKNEDLELTGELDYSTIRRLFYPNKHNK